jgi:hypothetical protein
MEPLMVEFSAFRDLFAALPSGALSLDEVRTAAFCLLFSSFARLIRRTAM